MEAQLQHPQVQRYRDDDHQRQQFTNTEGEAQDHGEKTSVLKKVKVKAKKIKESIKEHVHLHGREQHDNDHKQDETQGDHKSHLAIDPVSNRREDHTGHAGPRGVKGFTGAAGLGRLIIPEETPVEPRNTPIRQDVPNSGVEEASMEPKQSSYTEKITSVLADKATEVKNVVASKLQGVNLAEKLKPGDEDRALSQLISSKAGADPVKREDRKIAENERGSKNDKEVNLMGRVTESEEVARRLGTSEEERRGGVINIDPTGMEGPVREWIKETVSSCWNDDGNQQHSQTLQK